MKNSFSDYISSKVHDTIRSDNGKKGTLPFITISREYGCGGDSISKKLCDALSSAASPDGDTYQWKRINHEVIAEAAAEIGVPAEIVKEMTYHKIDDFFITSFFNFSFSKYTKPSATTVRNAIARVISNFAQEGRVIILGRGGASLTHNYENSLHIRLNAPREWRIQQVSGRENISLEKARVLTQKIDGERDSLRNYFEGPETGKTVFDAVFNTMTLSDDDILEALLSISRRKGFIS